MSMFLAMAAAAIDGLDRDERVGMGAQTFSRIIAICADVAEGKLADSESAPVCEVPRLAPVRVDLLAAQDRVWFDGRFRIVDHVDHWASAADVTYTDGHVEQMDLKGHKQIAASRACADAWNRERAVETPTS